MVGGPDLLPRASAAIGFLGDPRPYKAHQVQFRRRALGKGQGGVWGAPGARPPLLASASPCDAAAHWLLLPKHVSTCEQPKATKSSFVAAHFPTIVIPRHSRPANLRRATSTRPTKLQDYRSRWLQSVFLLPPVCRPRTIGSSLVRLDTSRIVCPCLRRNVTNSRRASIINIFTMAALLPRIASSAVLPIPRLPSLAGLAGRLLPTLGLALPGITITIPTLLDDIWEGILRAVPKNKVSHSRKRMRQLANKGLKDVNSLCQCPGCGAPKRMHRLCQNCLEGM